MRIKFLGTGASQGIPSPFCKCRVCENARKVKGKEIRSRSSVMIDGEMMIDYSPDRFLQSAINGEDVTAIKYFLITHSHYDHFSVRDLVENCDKRLEQNNQSQRKYLIGGNEKVCSIVESECKKAENGESCPTILMESKKSTIIGDYKVTALKSEHTLEEESLVYIIERDGKCYLHCCDSGELLKETIDYLINASVKLQAVTFDATFGLREEKFYGHMNLRQVVSMRDKLLNKNIITEKTKIYLTHISHSGRCTHEELSICAKKYGIEVAYDGLEIEI